MGMGDRRRCLGSKRPVGDLDVDRRDLLQLQDFLQCEKGGLVHFLSVRFRLALQGPHQHHHVGAVAVVFGVQVAHPQQADYLGLHPGLLLHLPHRGLFNGLVDLDESPRALPVAPTPARLAPDQQELSIADNSSAYADVIPGVIPFRWRHTLFTFHEVLGPVKYCERLPAMLPEKPTGIR